MSERTAFINHYTKELALGLVALNGKIPAMGDGWHKRPITNPNDFPDGKDIGLNHEYSRTATLDIDHPAAKLALEIVGIGLESLLEEAPYKIVGNPDNYPKPVFRIPEGQKLKVKQLKWPDPSGKVNANGTPHLISIFELRGGEGASQDVLPPSIHPDTGTVYTWLNGAVPPKPEAIPLLPEKLLMLWGNWDSLSDKLKNACPWAEKKQTQADSDFDVEIVQRKFNEKYKPAEILERNGYKLKGKKWLCPNSSSGIPGIIVLGEGEKIISFHGSDPLGDGYPHDAYDCAVILEYGGDKSKGWHELQKELGITFNHSTNGHGPAEPAEESKDTQTPEKPRMTDLGNARRLVAHYGHNLRYVRAWGKWYAWDGTRWGEDETGVIDRIAKEIPRLIYQEAMEADEDMRPKLMKWGATSESAGKIAAMIELARTEKGISIPHRGLDNQPMLLNCPNGTIDLTTGMLTSPRREHNLTKRIEVNYDPAARCPLWLAFLSRVMGGSQEMIDFLRRAVGYTLTGDVGEQCLFFMHGMGKNGKTVFSETLRNLFGEYGQKAPTDMLMVRYGNAPTNDMARLPGARFVIAAEVEEGGRLAEGKVKDLTGNDAITARFLHQEFFEFDPTHKLWMYGNHKPEIRGTDDGIWRRIHLIPFMVTITKEERDPQLIKKLKAELPGILAWAVQGCLEWQLTGLQVPELVEKATNSYRAESDTIAEFIRDKCVVDGRAKIKAGELHLEYMKWCELNNERYLKRPKFGRTLRERGFKSDDSSNYTEWLGIGLKAEFVE
jgi:P4 family phage/plasmid primase-like protien